MECLHIRIILILLHGEPVPQARRGGQAVRICKGVGGGGGRGQIMVNRISTPVLIATSEHPNHARFHAPEQGISAKRGWRPEIEKEEGPE